jgi:hypothetical protein
MARDSKKMTASEQAEHPTHHWHRALTSNTLDVGKPLGLECCVCLQQQHLTTWTSPLTTLLTDMRDSASPELPTLVEALRRVVNDLLERNPKAAALKKQSSNFTRAAIALGYEDASGETLRIPERAFADFDRVLLPRLQPAAAELAYFASQATPASPGDERAICTVLGADFSTVTAIAASSELMQSQLTGLGVATHYSTLGLVSTDSDDVIRMTVRCLMKDRPHKCRTVFDAIKVIADQRKTPDMLTFKREMQEVRPNARAVSICLGSHAQLSQRFELLDSTSMVLEELRLTLEAEDDVVRERMLTRMRFAPEQREFLSEMASLLMNARQTIGMQQARAPSPLPRSDAHGGADDAGDPGADGRARRQAVRPRPPGQGRAGPRARPGAAAGPVQQAQRVLLQRAGPPVLCAAARAPRAVQAAAAQGRARHAAPRPRACRQDLYVSLGDE